MAATVYKYASLGVLCLYQIKDWANLNLTENFMGGILITTIFNFKLTKFL